MTYKKYAIIIKVIDLITDDIVGTRTTNNTEVSEQILANVPQWIKNYEDYKGNIKER